MAARKTKTGSFSKKKKKSSRVISILCGLLIALLAWCGVTCLCNFQSAIKKKMSYHSNYML